MFDVSSILKSHIPSYFEFAKIATMQVLASVEDEKISSRFFFHEKKTMKLIYKPPTN
jgi:hypothetical protein